MLWDRNGAAVEDERFLRNKTKLIKKGTNAK